MEDEDRGKEVFVKDMLFATLIPPKEEASQRSSLSIDGQSEFCI